MYPQQPVPPPPYPPRRPPRRKQTVPTSVIIGGVVLTGVAMLGSLMLIVLIALATPARQPATGAMIDDSDAGIPVSVVATATPAQYTTVVEPTPTPQITTTTHIVEAGQELALIARMYNVEIDQIVALNGISDPDLLFVGQELIIPAEGIYQPVAAEAPIPPTATGKAIVVSISQQRIYAYENGRMIHSHLVSTGRLVTPTVIGDFNVYVKYLADDMAGPGYFLPQVPYTMYFHQGYAIHGTYWHNSFGRPMSHGCVNLPVEEAGWFFNFAEVGTPVRVIA